MMFQSRSPSFYYENKSVKSQLHNDHQNASILKMRSAEIITVTHRKEDNLNTRMAPYVMPLFLMQSCRFPVKNDG